MTTTRSAALLTAGYYAAIFTALGAHLPYWPVWLAEWGLDASEIAQLLGAATIARIVGATLLPAIADRFAIRRSMVAVTAALSAGTSLLLLAGTGDRVTLVLVTLAGAVVVAPATPLGEALAVRASERFGFAYAPARAAGSVGFLAANLGVGAALGQFGPDVVLWVTAVAFSVVAVLAWVHPGGGAAAGGGLDRSSLSDLRALLTAPVFLLFGLTAAIGQGAHAIYYAYSVLDWQARGVPEEMIGALWAFAVLVETVFMLTVGKVWVARLGASGALAIAACAGVLRWGVMALGPEGALLWPLQALHALTFALGHLAAIAFIAAAIPPRLIGSAQGIASGVLGGTVHAGILFAAAPVVALAGVEGAYAMAAGLAGLSAGLALVLARVWRGHALVA